MDPEHTLSGQSATHTTSQNEKEGQNAGVHKKDLNRRESVKNDHNTAQEKYCRLYKKPHPVGRCLTFRSKPLDERRTFLKELHYSFNCCASTKHEASDCRGQEVRKCTVWQRGPRGNQNAEFTMKRYNTSKEDHIEFPATVAVTTGVTENWEMRERGERGQSPPQ